MTRRRRPLMSLLDRPSLRRLLRRLPAGAQWSAKRIALGDRADEGDLAYCYRLLLDRSPDPAGWRHYASLIERGELSVQQLVLAFLSSLEFRRRGVLEPGDEAVELVALGPGRAVRAARRPGHRCVCSAGARTSRIWPDCSAAC